MKVKVRCVNVGLHMQSPWIKGTKNDLHGCRLQIVEIVGTLRQSLSRTRRTMNSSCWCFSFAGCAKNNKQFIFIVETCIMRRITTSVELFTSTSQQRCIFNGKLVPISYFMAMRLINDYEQHFKITWILHTHKAYAQLKCNRKRVEINKFDCCFSIYWIWQWSLHTTIISSIQIACKHMRNGHCIQRYFKKIYACRRHCSDCSPPHKHDEVSVGSGCCSCCVFLFIRCCLFVSRIAFVCRLFLLYFALKLEQMKDKNRMDVWETRTQTTLTVCVWCAQIQKKCWCERIYVRCDLGTWASE